MGVGNTGNTNTTASGGSAASGTSETFTAQDLWNFSNAGNSTKIIQLVTQADPASRTKTVSMSAADLGLPANGTVTFTITGSGIAFSETKSADADGYVRFEVPPVETDSTVAIELIVRAADGTVIYSGSKNLEVKEGSSADITLYRQAWTRATADRTVLTATASSADLATITITGATETPLLTPSSALLNIDPPVQEALLPGDRLTPAVRSLSLMRQPLLLRILSRFRPVVQLPHSMMRQPEPFTRKRTSRLPSTARTSARAASRSRRFLTLRIRYPAAAQRELQNRQERKRIPLCSYLIRRTAS